MSFLDAIRRFFNPTPEEKADKLRKRVTQMFGHPDDRKYALHQLFEMGPELAPTRLIERFTCTCENGTYDVEEKELTKDYLVELGQASVEPLKTFLRENDRDFSWPFKTLTELISHEELVAFIVELLKTIGPDYVRFPERKEQLMLTLKSYDEEEIKLGVLPYLNDDNETIRFVTADTVIAHAHPKGIEALAQRLAEEPSPRAITQIATAFRDNGWTIDESLREKVSQNLPQDFRINSKGVIL